MAIEPKPVKCETHNVQARSLMDRVARLLGKSQVTRRRAQNVVLDQRLFKVTPKIYAEFVARLDASPEPNESLRRTMTTQAPWD